MFALFPPLVGAQQPDSTPKDTSVLAPVVVTGVRLPAAPEMARGLTGRSASLSTAESDARGVSTLADALEMLPGVTAADELGTPAQLDVTLRGFQVSPTIGLPQGVTVYVDGVRVNEPDANEVNFDLLPLEDVERVDVSYGPSVLLGRNSLGAAVNLVTRRGSAPGQREVEVSGGSYGRYELKLNAGDRIGRWDYYVGARYERSDGWRQASASRLATAFAKLGVLAGGWNATLSYSGADNRISQAGSLPETVVATRPDSNFTSGDYFAPLSHVVTLNAQRSVGAGGGAAQLAVNAFGRSLGTDQFNVNATPPDSRQRNHERIGGGALQVAGRRLLAGRALRWFAGLDGQYSHTVVGLYAVRSGKPDSLSDSVRANELDLGAFAGVSWDVAPTVAATVVGRYDYVHLPYEDLLDPTQNGLNVFRRLSPRAALSWTGAGGGHEVYASWSAGFRTPALVEIACSDPTAACPLPFALGPDPALRPVVATTYEVGWQYRPPPSPSRGVVVGADLYRTDVRDDIFFVAPTATTGYFLNIGATRREGLEGSVTWTGRSGVSLYGNYGYTVASFRTTAVLSTGRPPGNETVTPGDRIPMIPTQRANAGVSLPLAGERLRARLDARYVGPQYLRGDEENVERRLPDYTVADAALEASFGRYDVRVVAPNVFDHSYLTFGTFAANPTVPGNPVERFVTPGMRRHLLVSVSGEF
ncbi:MAG TPA: TonB-dependent receptor [Gemmatimonadales bacterium]|nr:TonB-dependent receptor [Gemmatimonadales bacterium]